MRLVISGACLQKCSRTEWLMDLLYVTILLRSTPVGSCPKPKTSSWLFPAWRKSCKALFKMNNAQAYCSAGWCNNFSGQPENQESAPRNTVAPSWSSTCLDRGLIDRLAMLYHEGIVEIVEILEVWVKHQSPELTSPIGEAFLCLRAKMAFIALGGRWLEAEHYLFPELTIGASSGYKQTHEKINVNIHRDAETTPEKNLPELYCIPMVQCTFDGILGRRDYFGCLLLERRPIHASSLVLG